MNMGRTANPFPCVDEFRVVPTSYVLLGFSLAICMASLAFMPSNAMIVTGVVFPLVHTVIGMGIYRRSTAILHAFTGLLVVIYVTGLAFATIVMAMELFSPRRGSYKLYMVHLASVSALLTNVLLALLYCMFRLIGIINANQYSTMQNETI